MGEKALLRACREMLAAEERDELEEAEIVGNPSEYWLSDRRVSSTTVDLGLMFFLFKSEGVGTSYERYWLNEYGRSYAKEGKIPQYDR